jgi:cytochrome c peroxidase
MKNLPKILGLLPNAKSILLWMGLFGYVLTISLSSCRKDAELGNNPPAVPPSDDINPNATPFNLIIPPFFPPMDIPPSNPLTVEGVALGRYLFWEKKLSGNNTMSCGSCHLPSHGFADPNQFSTGISGEIGTRQAMALINLGWARDYFWDGRAKSLEEQIAEPIPNPIEMNESWENAVAKIAAEPMYAPMFEAAFGSAEVTQGRIIKAIASFLRTMISAESKFDKSRLGLAQLTDQEFRGQQLFLLEGGDADDVLGGQNGADCFHCHGFGDSQFSDYLPHNNGLDSFFSDLGVGGISGNPAEFGKFKTPTLRNVEFTAPYMHDGRFTSLEQVIEHYDSGGNPSSTIDPFMKFTTGGLNLPETDKAALIAFLKTLSDTSFLSNPAFQDPH